MDEFNKAVNGIDEKIKAELAQKDAVAQARASLNSIIQTWAAMEVECPKNLMVYRMGWWLYSAAFAVSRLLTVWVIAITWGAWDAAREAWEEFGESDD
jgi:hypothetical protein